MLTSSEQTKTASTAASNSFLQKKEQHNPANEQSSPLFFQPKLTIGAPDDIYEKEADTMADKIMRTPMPDLANFLSAKNTVNRKCSGCEAEEKLHRKESSSETALTAPSIVNDVLNSSGKSLDADTRSFMESRFNYDFSNVKIHDNNLAAKSASSINALAYTSGNNVVFNSGQYNPKSDSGKRLLAHELTHVVQQNGLTNSIQQNSSRKMIQAEFAVEPTTPGRAVRILTAPQIQEAIVFNQARHTDPAEIELLRRIMGSSTGSLVIDADFVEAVVLYQSQYGIKMDGKIGGKTADRLAREIIAESQSLGPGNLGTLAPEFALQTSIQTLITANNRTYIDYKAAIQIGTMIQRHVALLNQQLLIDLKAQLTWNEWARCIELLGRIAPTGAEMRTNTTVRAAMNAAWGRSNPEFTCAAAPPILAHEEGGYIYMNLVTGDLTTRAIPRGAQAALPFPVAPLVSDSVAVGLFHTHPNVGACWGAPFLSGADIGVSTHFGLPMLMIGAFPAIANTSFHAGGLTRRAHLAGARGGPGSIAPQARIDGSYDEV